jgi:uncharacterized repeat protein (TIGR01451 family)
MTKSNGSGPSFFAGRTGTHGLRRALIRFDILSSVPADSIVTSAVFQTHVNMAPVFTFGPADFALHRLESDWGEGASSSPNGGGGGAQAQPGDATWTNTFFGTGTWANVGGDFNISTTAVQTIVGVGFYTWSSSQMVDDVKAWFDTPTSNFGWIVIGDESTLYTARRFDSRESATASQRPLLTIGFIPPPDLEITKSASIGTVIAGSNLTYTVTVSNRGPRTATAVTVTDLFSADLSILSGSASTNLGMMAIGASTVLTYRASVAASALNSVSNIALVTSDTVDPIPGNDQFSVATGVDTICDLSIDKAAAGPGIIGQTAVQVVTVSNAGPSDAQNVYIVDTLPACVLFISASAAGSCVYSQGVVHCGLGTIPAGQAASALIRVEYLIDGVYTNTAITTTDTTDVSLLNNSTQAVTRIAASGLFYAGDTVFGPVTLGSGSDGSLVVSNAWQVDSAQSALASNAASGASTISVIDAGSFSTGDELLLFAAQGASTNAGCYESVYVQSASGNEIALSGALAYEYDISGGVVSVQRVPHFSSVTVLTNGLLTASEWNGTNGGVVVFRVAGELNVQAGGAISADGIGFRGGAAVVSTNEVWSRPDGSGWQGESFSGQGVQDNTNANLGGGGAGLHEIPPGFGTDTGTGGGGAGHATAGTAGEDNLNTSLDFGGYPGLTYGTNTLSKLFMGSGGGSGGHDKDNFLANPGATISGKGGNGGGILLIAAGALTLDGILSARGDAGTDAAGIGNADEVGGGGGGSGGSILLFVGSYSNVATSTEGGEGGRGGRTDNPSIENRGGTGGDGRELTAKGRQANLAITKSVPTGPYLLGEDLVYTLSITNQGPSDASGVIVVDFLPAGATFLSVTSDLCQCAISNDVVRCDTGTNAAI